MTELSSSVEKTVISLTNGTRLHLDSPACLDDARFIIREIFAEQVYRQPGFELHPADTILDVGSDVGVFAHWAAPQIPQGRMICIEPSSAAGRFEHSLAQNGITNVRLHRCAASAPSSTLEIIDHPQFAGLNRSSHFQQPAFTRLLLAYFQKKEDQGSAQARTVPCRSLEEIMAEENLSQCDLLKMDCEGGEFAILEHTSRQVLRRFRRIMMEFYVYHSTHSLRKLIDRFEADGFAVRVKKKWLNHLLTKTGMLWATRID
jgi:FkbM family methyltransferase